MRWLKRNWGWCLLAAFIALILWYRSQPGWVPTQEEFNNIMNNALKTP